MTASRFVAELGASDPSDQQGDRIGINLPFLSRKSLTGGKFDALQRTTHRRGVPVAGGRAANTVGSNAGRLQA
jgi:predicted oxidoreductase